ncbi:hypothetical protein K227x_50350 [Rubripirellula lacrimiformis]|uniref:Uncharacterized protein n=1 Tax=Rubripirellula lacrimiformis TaxID=1930273 RepID=A0A517NHL5_9BACT|nr:hypothetical protein [Rubripirellula lacrimiformis]QDT06624.1 hypothetical protein K227x_50350 [Rubripirellula lacrimiformis]
MAKNNDLKRSLKAADRRRSRRPRAVDSTGASAAQSSASNQVDVSGLLVVDILAAHRESGLRDSELVVSLRACLAASTPSQDRSQQLMQRLAQIENRDDVSPRAYREAVRGILATALQHRVADNDHAFMQFLTVLSN